VDTGAAAGDESFMRTRVEARFRSFAYQIATIGFLFLTVLRLPLAFLGFLGSFVKAHCNCEFRSMLIGGTSTLKFRRHLLYANCTRRGLENLTAIIF